MTSILSDPPAWSTVATRSAFRNRWIGVMEDTVELPTGQSYAYTRLEPAGIGVGVVGFDAAGRILLEREYRHGVHQVIWQIPGGLADPGEDLQTAGLRELREETGYAPPWSTTTRCATWAPCGTTRPWAPASATSSGRTA